MIIEQIRHILTHFKTNVETFKYYIDVEDDYDTPKMLIQFHQYLIQLKATNLDQNWEAIAQELCDDDERQMEMEYKAIVVKDQNQLAAHIERERISLKYTHMVQVSDDPGVLPQPC